MPTVYGLKSCDSCRKALKRLDGAGLTYRFVDLKVEGLSPERARQWLAQVPADRLINRRGTTWRGLDGADKARAETAEGAAALVAANPSLAKRPVIEHEDGGVTVGFDDAVAQRLGLD